jgi:hypothetical protein
MAKPFLVEVEREDAEGGLAEKRSGRWWLVLVEMDGERGKSSIEGRRRCEMLWGQVSPFIRPVGELKWRGKAVELPELWRRHKF